MYKTRDVEVRLQIIRVLTVIKVLGGATGIEPNEID